MIVWLLTALMAASQGDVSPDTKGKLEGIVVNGSRDDAPVAGADVLLRAGRENYLEPIEKTKADAQGRFQFCVPLDSRMIYLPGADQDGVYYPGKRVQLDERHPQQHVAVRVFDAVKRPSPLVADHLSIEVDVDQQVMTVRETVMVKNDSLTTFVGERIGSDAPETFRLRIPPNFDRVTFAKEFYGRRFRIVDHALVTDIPWPPGQREVSFAYRVPLEHGAGIFRRTIDLPCTEIAIRVRGAESDGISCNLPAIQKAGREVVFASAGRLMGTTDAIELQIGKLSPPWSVYARWGVVGLLSVLILASALRSQLCSPSNRPANQNLARDSKQNSASMQAPRAA
jgi:hypothetical protein